MRHRERAHLTRRGYSAGDTPLRRRRVRAGGLLLVLVPSSESARAVACAYRASTGRDGAGDPRRACDRRKDFALNPTDTKAHVWLRWGVRTQCYTAAMVQRMFDGVGKVEQLLRVEYEWHTELNGFRVRDKSRPYDWLVAVRKA